jgi:hypothetical protein
VHYRLVPRQDGLGDSAESLADAGDPGRITAADFMLESIREVERFLNVLAR